MRRTIVACLFVLCRRVGDYIIDAARGDFFAAKLAAQDVAEFAFLLEDATDKAIAERLRGHLRVVNGGGGDAETPR